MNKIRFSIILIFALFLPSCANHNQARTDAQPSWILNESETYPRKRFIVGVGEGDSLNDAKSRARAELASNFHVNIDSQTKDLSAFTSNAEKSSTDVSIERLTRSHTQQVLEGVAISDSWYDNKTQHYFALATLSRLKTANQLRQRIEEIDQGTSSQIRAIKQESSIFKKSVLSKRAIEQQSMRQALNQQYRIVSLSGRGIDSPWPIAKLRADRKELLSRIHFLVESEGELGDETESILIGILSKEGYSVAKFTLGIDNTTANQTVYALKAKVRSDTLEPKGGWYMSSNTALVTIDSPQEGVLSSHQWYFKTSATQQSMLRVRTLKALSSVLEKELSEKLLEQIN